MGDLSRNFSRSEFACKGEHCCGHSAPVMPELVAGLQALRARVGLPLSISSGFRCHTHNATIGGASDSQHTLGTAADVRCPEGFTPKSLAQLAEPDCRAHAKCLESHQFDGLPISLNDGSRPQLDPASLAEIRRHLDSEPPSVAGLLCRRDLKLPAV